MRRTASAIIGDPAPTDDPLPTSSWSNSAIRQMSRSADLSAGTGTPASAPTAPSSAPPAVSGAVPVAWSARASVARKQETRLSSLAERRNSFRTPQIAAGCEGGKGNHIQLSSAISGCISCIYHHISRPPAFKTKTGHYYKLYVREGLAHTDPSAAKLSGGPGRPP